MPAAPIRYRWRDKTTGEVVKFKSGSNCFVAKNGNLCVVNQYEEPVYGGMQDNLILEIATHKLDGKWAYEVFDKPREKFSLAYRVAKFLGVK